MMSSVDTATEAQVEANPSQVENEPDDFEAFDMPTNEDLDVIEVPAPQPAEPQVEAPKGETQATPPEAQPGPKVEPAGPQQEAPAAEQQPSQEPSETGVGESLNFLDMMAQHREAIEQELAQNFELSEQDIDEIQTSVETAIPKLMGRVLYQAMTSVHRQLQEFAPVIMNRTMQTQRAIDQAETQFFESFPALRKLTPEQNAQLQTVTKGYVAANPGLDLATRIQHIGNMAHQMFGIPLQSPAPPRAKPSTAFKPAVGSLPPSPQAPSGDADPFEGMDLPFQGDE